MTRKHFEAIASIIKANQHASGIEGVANEMADYFATVNPNFDRARFIKACGA